jgi:hypothetical protein
MFGLACIFHFGFDAVPVGFEGLVVGIFALFQHGVARHEIRIAAQQNIGSAARHVGGNCD